MITLNIKRVIPVKKKKYDSLIINKISEKIDDWIGSQKRNSSKKRRLAEKKNIISNKIDDYIEYQTRNSSKEKNMIRW